MKRFTTNILTSMVIGLLLIGFTGCDAVKDVFENDKDASGAVEEVGADYLVVEAITYSVTEQTTFDGVDGLADIAVGTEVEIEYEENGGGRTALEIEVGDND